MSARQRSVVNREGWYYLFILAFVILGSLLRNIQLLVGLSAVLATAMILNWRWTRAMMRRLVIRRRAPDTLWAGRYANFSCEIENPRARLSAWALMVHYQFRKQPDATTAGSTDGEEPWSAWLGGTPVGHGTLIDAIHPGQVVTAKQSVKFRGRGRYLVGPIRVSTHFPLGLVRREWCDPQKVPVQVGPAIGSLSQSWVEQMLGLGWNDSQQGRTARSGEDFYSLRPYSPGDSIRWIHWRASARHRSLLVKQFQRSQPKAFSLVVDLGTPPSSAERVTHDEVEKILRILATVSEAVWSRGLSNIRLTLIADQEHSIRFPADENDWVSWHRALSMARPHDQPLRLLASLKELIELDRARAASPAPVVVLSACSLADYVTRLQAIDDAPAAPPVTVSAQDWEMGSGGPTSEFWALQQSIRSWFTPGDSWLSSWYLDTVDQDPPEHGRGELQRSPGGPISATPDPTTTPLVGRQPRSLANGLPGAKSGVNSDVNSDAKSAANSGGNSDANSATGAAVTGRSDRSASESAAAVGVADWGSKEGTPQ